jgi:chromosome segregation ATPase
LTFFVKVVGCVRKDAVSEELTKELPGGTPFERRMLAEFAALRGEVGSLRTEVGSLRSEVGSLRSEVAEIRTQQIAMARNIAALDQRLTSMDGRLNTLDGRLTSLEEKVDSRLKETRPIWEAVQAQIAKLDEKFNLFILDLYDIRGTLRLHGKRLDII